MIILMAGLPGSGKSWLARELAAVITADVLDRDVVRNQIFPEDMVDYSADQNELASKVTYMVAEYILERHPERKVILDGRPFSKRKQIEVVQKLAETIGQPMKILYCWAPEEIVAERLASDLQRTQNISADRTMKKYKRIKREFHPIEVDHLDIDTSQHREVVLRKVLDYLDI